MSKNYLSYKHTYFGMSNSFTKNYNIDEKIIKLELYQNVIQSKFSLFFAKIYYYNFRRHHILLLNLIVI